MKVKASVTVSDKNCGQTQVVKKRTSVGSGRTRGSYSFVKVTLETLKQYAGDKAFITVSRLWCEEVGLIGGMSANAEALHKTRYT